MSVHLYDPAEVLVLIAGVPLSGFSRDQFVSVSFDGDTFIKDVGVYGEVSRYRNVNDSGSMTVSLSQTSNSNVILSSLSSVDRQWGVGVVPIAIIDMAGGSTAIEVRSADVGIISPEEAGRRAIGFALGTKMMSAHGWIRKPPPISMKGKSLGDRSWTIDLARLDIFQVSGNQSQFK